MSLADSALAIAQRLYESLDERMVTTVAQWVGNTMRVQPVCMYIWLSLLVYKLCYYVCVYMYMWLLVFAYVRVMYMYAYVVRM